MAKENETNDTSNREIVTKRLLNAPRELVFKVWTEPEHIAQWYGPNGFTNTVHEMDVKPGGVWRFMMHGPNGMEFPNKIVYTEVERPERLSFQHSSEDEKNPVSFDVIVTFEAQGDKTMLTMRSIFPSIEERTRVVKEVGAIEGAIQTIDKLEAYLNAQQSLRKQLKTNNMSRVTTYLNFNTETEKAFNFYKSVFGTEFVGPGVQRFGEIPQGEGAPAVAEEIKNLVLHIELPILGGHILMGTDAPESMGFNLNFGNNVHINLEPESREETKKLYESLSAGGKVTMELQDMFFGSYYGSCTDKFGVQWMFNCNEKAN